MRQSLILAAAVAVAAGAGCSVFSPPSPPAPEATPAIVLPLPGTVTLPIPKASGTPQAPPRSSPSPSGTPTPAASNPCPTPPPGYCCGIVFGSIQGAVADPDGQPVPSATVTLQTTDGSLLGGCSSKVTSAVVNGAYAFNAVPFGRSVIVEATAPGYEPFRQTLTMPKGTIYTLDISLKRST